MRRHMYKIEIGGAGAAMYIDLVQGFDFVHPLGSILLPVTVDDDGY